MLAFASKSLLAVLARFKLILIKTKPIIPPGTIHKIIPIKPVQKHSCHTVNVELFPC